MDKNTDKYLEILLKEAIEGYNAFMNNPDYYCDRGKGTKSYALTRIQLLRSKLLEMQNNIKAK